MPGRDNRETEHIKIKYHDEKLTEITKIEIGDWVDLRSAVDVSMKAGEFKYISLGVTIEVPEGYELWIAPRSSTFKNFGIIQTNSIGVIDQSYCGDDDVLHLPALAMRDTTIIFDDRICQCRLMKNQPEWSLDKVDFMDNANRGGLGHTGVK